MKRGAAGYLAWGLWAVCIAGAATAVLLRNFPNALVATSDPLGIAFGLAFVGYATVGAVVAWRRPENPIGWLLIAAGFFSVLGEAAEQVAIYALFVNGAAFPGGPWAAWMTTWTESLSFGQVPLLTLLFPAGKPLSSRWRWVGWAIVGTRRCQGRFDGSHARRPPQRRGLRRRQEPPGHPGGRVLSWKA